MEQIKHRLQLPSLMKELNLPMVAAEIGTAEGFFANDLINEGIGKLYAVDAWENIPGQKGDGSFSNAWHNKNYDAAMERLAPHGEKVIVLRGRSREMAQRIPDNTLGLVNVDCDHSLAGVSNDIVAYWPKLVSGGIMSFHDYENEMYGVKQAVTQFAKENNLEIHLLPENKPEDAGAYFIKP